MFGRIGTGGYHVETVSDGETGLARCRETRPDLLIVDLMMPGIGSMDVLRGALERDSDIVVVVITGFATVATAVDAMEAGAYDFIPKPFTAQELRVIIDRAAERRRLVQQDPAGGSGGGALIRPGCSNSERNIHLPRVWCCREVNSSPCGAFVTESVADVTTSADFAPARINWGNQRIWIKLRREAWLVNRKRVDRLYKQEEPAMRPTKPR